MRKIKSFNETVLTNFKSGSFIPNFFYNTPTLIPENTSKVTRSLDCS